MLPLVTRGEAIGLIEIVDDNDRDWSDDDVEFCRSLADVAAAAIANAQLHERHRAAEARYRSLIEHLPAVTYIDVGRHRRAGLRQPADRDGDGRPRARSGWTTHRGWAQRHPSRRRRRGRRVRRGACLVRAVRRRVPADRPRGPRPAGSATPPARCATPTASRVYMQGVIFDITARKEAEAALGQSEARFREMLENVRLVAVTCDVDGRIMFCNQYLAELTGLVGRGAGRPRLDRDADAAEDHREMEQRAMSLDQLRPHGRRTTRARSHPRRPPAPARPGTTRVLRDLTGAPIGAASIGEDITDRRDAERGAGAPRLPRPADRAAEPRSLFQEHLDLALARAAPAGDGVAVLLRRPRRLQARQRQLRARRRRRAAVRGRRRGCAARRARPTWSPARAATSS